MSLKAKIEAVIYASEEPVTLAQLTGLLGQEGQAELDAIAAQQHTLALQQADADEAAPAPPGTALDPDALNDEVLLIEDDNAAPEDNAPEPTTDPDSDEPPTNPAPTTDPEPDEPPTNPAPPTDPGAPSPASGTQEVAPPNPVEPTEPTTPTAEPTKTEANQKEAARKLRDYFRFILDQLIADYATSDRGLEIREVAGGFRLATKPEYHDAVRGFVKSLKPPLKLSLQALETLAVVAYKQPVTAPEVSEIRGVDSGGVLGSLLGRKLVTTAGRKQVIGRPILYKTTKDFLLRFGLKDINELPSIEEFEKMAGELNDAVQEEIQMEHPAAETPAAIADETTPDTDPLELEGHNLQPIDHPAPDPAEPLSNEAPTNPDAPTTEPESISPTGTEPGDDPDPQP